MLPSSVTSEQDYTVAILFKSGHLSLIDIALLVDSEMLVEICCSMIGLNIK